jgi:lysozyme family protein
LSENSGLAQASGELGLTEADWRAFVKETFHVYRAEIAQHQGALANPDEVRFLQQALNHILGAGLTVDGLWGPSTEAQLVAFQQRVGLKPDGILGPKTMTALKQRYTLERVNALQ